MKEADIYTEALACLRSILMADHPELQNWIDWLERDIQEDVYKIQSVMSAAACFSKALQR